MEADLRRKSDVRMDCLRCSVITLLLVSFDRVLEFYAMSPPVLDIGGAFYSPIASAFMNMLIFRLRNILLELMPILMQEAIVNYYSMRRRRNV